jgi:glycosyltransferase involved in cell wall biosynthesis
VPSADRQAMAAELSKAALVVLLSDYETHPIAALEAISLGKPVIVADTSGMTELAERGLARAIPLSSSPEQIADVALEQLHQPLKPSNLALPTWEDCANKLLDLYQSICRAPLCES